MPKSTEPLTRHNILLTAGSYEKLQDLYKNSVGAAGVVRLLINTHLERVEKAATPPQLDKVLEENGL